MNPKPRHRYIYRRRLEERMTVCIAAKATWEDKDVIVSVTDTKLTTGLYSQESGALKVKRLTKYWSVMIAGHFSQNRPIVDALRDELVKVGEETLDVGDVSAACTKVYIAEAKRLAEESILARFGLTMEDFLNSRKRIGESLFERTWGEVSRIQIGCDFLVWGFDKAGSHIFCVSNPTIDNPSFITDHDFPGFAAIGTGSYLAESTMYAFDHHVLTPLPQAIYHATTAKFVAESASDVGASTILIVLGADGWRVPLQDGLSDKLRDRWMQKGKPSVPGDALEIINTAIASGKPGQ